MTARSRIDNDPIKPPSDFTQAVLAALADERRIISRDLHDRVGQNLAAALHRMDRGGDGDAAAARALIGDALAETEAIANGIRSFAGDHPLADTFNDFIATLDGPPTVRVVTTGAPVALTNHASDEVFLIVREAVVNARNHAEAKVITVTYAWHREHLVVTVTDNGTGFRRDNVRPGSLGLTSMRERADLIDADLRVESVTGAGTEVSLRMPLIGLLR